MVEKTARLLSVLLVTLEVRPQVIMAIETPANRLLHLLDRVGLDEWFFRLRLKIIPQRNKKKPLWKPIHGFRETLIELAKRYPLAIISVRDTQLTQSFIEQNELSSLITCWASAETTRHTKPFADPIQWAAEQLGVSPSECLMVGDTTVDIQAGKNAGAQTVGVLSGFGEEKELCAAGAYEVIEDVNRLLKMLK
jgi:phosphoglycolate phosphatase-like HAD superfamily hydrolase